MNKILKIALKFVGIAIIVFFVTGIIFDQTTYTNSITVNKPITEVFEKFTNVNLLKEWNPKLKSVKISKETPNKVGTVYEKEIENNGRFLIITEEIKAYVPNQKITYFLDANITLKTDSYQFSEKDGKTTITKNSIIESGAYIMDCIYPWMKGTFKKMDQAPLDNFKVMLEK